MLSDVQETRRDSTRLKQASWGLLLAGVLLSLWSWMNAGQRIQTEADLAFEGRTRAYTHHLMQVVNHHMDVLTSFQAMFRVNGQVDLATFTAHHQALQVAQEYPALMAVQYAPLVHAADRDAFLARMRQAHPGYRIVPQGERETYLPVAYNLPMAGNQAAFGYDMVFDAVRRRVMEDARDSGRLQVSPPIQLIQGGKEPLAVLVRLRRRVDAILESRYRALEWLDAFALAVAVPAGFQQAGDAAGLPWGVTLAAPAHRDLCLLRLADRLQQVLDAPLDGQAGPRLADLPAAEAMTVQKGYLRDYGTSLAGLMAHYRIDPHHFLGYVHDIDMGRIETHWDEVLRLTASRAVEPEADA